MARGPYSHLSSLKYLICVLVEKDEIIKQITLHGGSVYKKLIEVKHSSVGLSVIYLQKNSMHLLEEFLFFPQQEHFYNTSWSYTE